METLEDLFVHELKDLHSAERQIVKALPKMAKAASTPELRRAFEEHLAVTKTQIERLDEVFDMLGENPGRKKCKGMEGLIEEGASLLEEDVDPKVLDAGLITAAQKVEHYEMAGYGSVRTYAKFLGHDEAANLLQETLNEEGEADKKLSSLAERMINARAADGERGPGTPERRSVDRSQER